MSQNANNYTTIDCLPCTSSYNLICQIDWQDRLLSLIITGMLYLSQQDTKQKLHLCDVNQQWKTYMISFHNSKIESYRIFTRSKYFQVNWMSPRYIEDAAMRPHLVLVALNEQVCAGVVAIAAWFWS